MKEKIYQINDELKKEGLFCLHQNKIPMKKRYSQLVNASPNKKEDFKKYDDIIKDYESSNASGIGIGFFDSLCGIDIDHCIDEKGKYSNIAQEIIKKLYSYTEKSLSGTGIHIIFKCNNQEEVDSVKYYTKMNEKQLQENGFTGTGGLELYQGNFDNRYFTLTGDTLINDLKTIDFSVIKEIIDKYMKRPEMTLKTPLKSTSTPSDDTEYIERGLQLDTKLIELWNSTPSGKGGNESETDLALMNKLAYWTNKNEILMKEYFERSPYFQKKDSYHQKKWNTRDDYQQDTISKAIAFTTGTAKEKEEKFMNDKQSREEKKQEQLEKIKDTLSSGSAMNQIEHFFETIDKGTFKPISTGFKNLDDKLNGGLSMQSIVMLNGGTSTGKTTFTLNLCLNLAKDRPVIYFTLEMSKEQILSKIYSNIAYKGKGMTISSTSILQSYDKNKMTDYQREKLIEEIKKHDELNNFFVIFPDSSNIDFIMNQIQNITEELESEGKQSPLIVIDYLQFIQGNSREDIQSLIKRIQRNLKKYAIEHDSLVFLLSANSREANRQKETSIDMGRDTSDIEYSSDYLFTINFYEWEHNPKSEKSRRELSKDNPRKMTITIHKQRMGSTGEMIDFKFNGITSTFEEIEETTQRERGTI